MQYVKKQNLQFYILKTCGAMAGKGSPIAYKTFTAVVGKGLSTFLVCSYHAY